MKKIIFIIMIIMSLVLTGCTEKTTTEFTYPEETKLATIKFVNFTFFSELDNVNVQFSLSQNIIYENKDISDNLVFVHDATERTYRIYVDTFSDIVTNIDDIPNNEILDSSRFEFFIYTETSEGFKVVHKTKGIVSLPSTIYGQKLYE